MKNRECSVSPGAVSGRMVLGRMVLGIEDSGQVVLEGVHGPLREVSIGCAPSPLGAMSLCNPPRSIQGCDRGDRRSLPIAISSIFDFKRFV